MDTSPPPQQMGTVVPSPSTAAVAAAAAVCDAVSAPLPVVHTTTSAADGMWMLLQYVLNEQYAHFNTLHLDPSLQRSTPAVVADDDEQDTHRDVHPTSHCSSMFFPFEHFCALVRDAGRSLVVIATCADGPPDNHPRVVGMCWWTTTADLRRTTPEIGESSYDMHIQHLSVLHSHRRRGIGTKLLQVAHTGWFLHHQKAGGGTLPPGVTIRSWLRQPVPRGQAPFWTKHRYYPVDVLHPATTAWRCDLAVGPPPSAPYSGGSAPTPEARHPEARHPVLARAQQNSAIAAQVVAAAAAAVSLPPQPRPVVLSPASQHYHRPLPYLPSGGVPAPASAPRTTPQPHNSLPARRDLMVTDGGAQHALAMQLTRLAEDTAAMAGYSQLPASLQQPLPQFRPVLPNRHQPTTQRMLSSFSVKPQPHNSTSSSTHRVQKKRKQKHRGYDDDGDDDNDPDFVPSSSRSTARPKYSTSVA